MEKKHKKDSRRIEKKVLFIIERRGVAAHLTT